MIWRDVIEEDGSYFCGLIFFAAMFILLAVFSGDWAPLPADLAYVVSPIALLIWPPFVMDWHRRKQDRILDRIRAAYVMATGFLMEGNEILARKRLHTIRNLEWQWRLGASHLYRLALLSYVIVTNMAWGLLYWFLSVHVHSKLYRKDDGLLDTAAKMWDNPWWLAIWIGVAFLFSIGPALRYANVKSRPWSEFYGDHLKAALKAGRGIQKARQHKRRGLRDGVSSRELLGLNPGFSKAELRRAWIRLAGELHPDRWIGSGEGVRRMKEAGLKRVNAARDELMAQAA